jgi:hypothetical protein
MRLLVPASAVLAFALAGFTSVDTQSPGIDELRQRVAAYTRRFITQFSNVVTEEEYEQRFSTSARRRRLRSDFLLVAYPGKKDLVMVFRDVREVDGKPVRDKDDRIIRLLVQPFDNAVRRARDIHRDGLRFNVDNGRMMDPLTAIGYLQQEYQAGFRFSLGGMAADIGPDVREIDLLPTAARGRTASQARAWVSETTGEVFKTELRSGFGARAQITTTTFSPDPVLKIRVPVEMRDEVSRGGDDFIGVAKYSNVRRFDVTTESVVTVPDPSNRQ